MIKRWLRLPLALLIRMVVTRPYLKRLAQRTMLRLPRTAGFVRSLARQSFYQPPRNDRLQGPGHMTPRSLRIYRALKKEGAGRAD